MTEISAVILAAGEGKRMKSKLSKVVHKVCGKEMINHCIDASYAAGADECCVVIGHAGDTVIEAVGEEASFVWQNERLGTGHAVMQAKERIALCENVLVLTGDTPLITGDTLKSAIKCHIENSNDATVITAVADNPFGYGRIVRKDGRVEKIVEQKDTSKQQQEIKEINSGMYVFRSKELLQSLDKIKNDNAQGEYYLTDVLEILNSMGKKVGAFTAPDPNEILGVNDRVQLAEAEKIMRRRINEKFMRAGVTIKDPDNTYICADAIIGIDTVIYPGAVIEGKCVIGENVYIGHECFLQNAVIGSFTDVNISTIIDSSVGENTHVGPYAYIRPGCDVGSNCKVGDFVELKKAHIGDGTKLSHLTYVGDATVGKNVNFGCGTVVVNYDGKKKYQTVIKDNAFIGCNSNLVSPVTVNEGAYIAAGSTITDEVPADALAIARARQVVKTNWSDRRKKN